MDTEFINVRANPGDLMVELFPERNGAVFRGTIKCPYTGRSIPVNAVIKDRLYDEWRMVITPGETKDILAEVLCAAAENFVYKQRRKK